MKQIFSILLAAILFPYLVTLVWTGNAYASQEANHSIGQEAALTSAQPKGRKILLDRGDIQSYVALETYLEGILAKQLLFLGEKPYQKEVYKAQAIIARTYLYRLMGDAMEIPESALDLDYIDEAAAKKLWLQDDAVIYFEQIREAVQATKGQVMKLEDEYILPLFHQISSGKTRTGESIYPYLQSVSCSFDPLADGFQQEILINKEIAAKRISAIANGVPVTASQLPQEIQLVSKDEAGYIVKIQVGGKEYSGEQIQYALSLPSASFAIADADTDLRIATKGSGHGYGLSQNEAWQKASEGWTAEDILFYFYPGIIFYYE